MSTYTQPASFSGTDPGSHVDPDQLAAFLEGALPEPERLATLRHMAGCEQCRELAFITQTADPAFAAEPFLAPDSPLTAAEGPSQTAPAQPAPPRRTVRAFLPAWLRGPALPGLSAAALAGCVLAVLFVQFHHSTRPTPQSGVSIALSHPAQVQNPAGQPAAPPQPSRPIPTSPEPARQQPLPTRPVQTGRSLVESRTAPAGAADDQTSANSAVANSPLLPEDQTVPQSPVDAKKQMRLDRSIPAPQTALATNGLAAPSPLARPTPLAARRSIAPEPVPGVPPSTPNAPAPAATPVAPAPTVAVESTPLPQLSLPAPAPPVKSLPPADNVNATADTVEVSAAAVVNGATLTPLPEAPLPSRLPSAASAAAGKLHLALDTGHTLFRSQDGGQHWRGVKPRWPGAIKSLQLTPDSRFQLTLDTGEQWFSKDGRHWSFRRP